LAQVILTIGDHHQHPACLDRLGIVFGLGGKEAKGCGDALCQGRAPLGRGFGPQGHEEGSGRFHVGGQWTLHEGRAGKSHQRHPVLPHLIQKRRNLGTGPLKAIWQDIPRAHGFGHIQRDDHIQTATGKDLGARSPPGPAEGEDEGNPGKNPHQQKPGVSARRRPQQLAADEPGVAQAHEAPLPSSPGGEGHDKKRGGKDQKEQEKRRGEGHGTGSPRQPRTSRPKKRSRSAGSKKSG
jgi:hypothetical protein